MGKLSDHLMQETVQPQVIIDCVALIDLQVQQKKGISGTLLKTSYKAFKAVMPNMTTQAIELLLPDFAGVFDQFYEEYLKQSNPPEFKIWLFSRKEQVADQMLAVTDVLIQYSEKRIVKSIYQRLRKSAHRNVSQAVEDIADLIIKYSLLKKGVY